MVGLVITGLVVASGILVVVDGLRVRYGEPADMCAAVDISPVAALLGRAAPRVDPAVVSGDCVGQVGDLNQPPVALVRVSASVLGSTAEALFGYETNADTDVPGAAVALPGGPRGRLSAEAFPQSQSCRYAAELQDVNVTMKASLEVVPESGVRSCDPHDAAARALAATMRNSLRRLR